MMNVLPVILLYLEVFLLVFAEKRLWKTWFTPLNCLAVPYAAVLAVCLCINGRMDFFPFYFPSVWVWVIGLAVFFVPSLVLGLRFKPEAKTPGLRLSPTLLRVFEWMTGGSLVLFAGWFVYLVFLKHHTPGTEDFAVIWAGKGFFGHLFTFLMGTAILWIFLSDKEHKRYLFYILGFFVVGFLYLAKCWLLIPLFGGVLLRLLSNKTHLRVRLVLGVLVLGFVLFFASYWTVMYLTRSEKEVGWESSREAYRQDVAQYIPRHFVFYSFAGVYGLSEDMAQGVLETKDPAKIYTPFINVCKVFGNKDYATPINDQYIKICRYDNGTNVRTFFGTVYVHLGWWQGVLYVLLVSCLFYGVFLVAHRRNTLFWWLVLGWILGSLLMGWFDFYISALSYITVPCYMLLPLAVSWLVENREKIRTAGIFQKRNIRKFLAKSQTITLSLLLLFFWIPWNVPSYLLGACVIVAFLFVWTLPKRALDFRFLKPYLALFALYLLLWISVAYASDPHRAVEYNIQLIALVLVPFVFWAMSPRFFSKKRLQGFAVCFVSGCALLCVAKTAMVAYMFDCLWPYFKVYYMDAGFTYRGSGLLYVLNEFTGYLMYYYERVSVEPFMHQTLEALVLNVAVALLYMARIQKHPWLNTRGRKVLTDFVLLFFALMLVTTNSKTGQFLFLLNLLLFLCVLVWKRQWKAFGFVGGLLLVSGCIGFYYLGPGITSRFQRTIYVAQQQKMTEKKEKILPEDGDGSLSPRLYFWNTALEMVKEKPVFGYGASAKRDFKTHFRQKHPEYKKTCRHAHNQALDVMLSTGILGLLLFVCFLVQAIGLVWKNHQVWAWVWLLGMILFCCIDVFFHLQIALFYLCIPLCFMMAERYNQRHSKALPCP